MLSGLPPGHAVSNKDANKNGTEILREKREAIVVTLSGSGKKITHQVNIGVISPNAINNQ